MLFIVTRCLVGVVRYKGIAAESVLVLVLDHSTVAWPRQRCTVQASCSPSLQGLPFFQNQMFGLLPLSVALSNSTRKRCWKTFEWWEDIIPQWEFNIWEEKTELIRMQHPGTILGGLDRTDREYHLSITCVITGSSEQCREGKEVCVWNEASWVVCHHLLVGAKTRVPLLKTKPIQKRIARRSGCNASKCLFSLYHTRASSDKISPFRLLEVLPYVHSQFPTLLSFSFLGLPLWVPHDHQWNRCPVPPVSCKIQQI